MKNNLVGKNVLSYTRVSTKDQKDFGNSLTSQKNAIKNYCNFNQMNIVEFFEEDFSAKNFIRPVFLKLKEFAKNNKGKIDYILVHKWDRFTRNIGLGLVTIEYFKKMGIEINCVDYWVDYNSPDHIVSLSIYLATPEAENSKISERTKSGTRQALKDGRYVNRQPVGYISGKDSLNKTLMKPDPVFSPLIKDLFEDFATGLYTQQDVLAKYNKKGLKLCKSALSRTLENPLYMGMVVVPAFKTEPETLIDGLHIPIISKEVFYIVQRVKNGNRKQYKTEAGKNENFPLTGFLECAECGKVVYGSQSNNGKSKKITRTYYYYQCNSKHKCQRYKTEIVHQALQDVFSEIKPSNAVLELFEKILIEEYKSVKADRLNHIQNIDRKITELNQNQLSLTEKFGIGKIKEDIYGQLMDNYETEMIDLRASKAELGDYQKDLDKYISFGLSLLTNLSEYYVNAGIEVKNKLIGSIFTEKLIFQNDTFRTRPFNEAIGLLSMYNKGFRATQNKKGSLQKKTSLSVPEAGVEPARFPTGV